MLKKRYARIKSKVWIEDENGRIIFGPGRMRMLTAIQRCGSLNAAAKNLGMSYRGLWAKIKTTEKALGTALLFKGAVGSRLTPYAKKIMRRYDHLKQTVRLETDRRFEKDFKK